MPKELPASCGTQMFITVFTIARRSTLSWVRWIESAPAIFTIPFNIILYLHSGIPVDYSILVLRLKVYCSPIRIINRVLHLLFNCWYTVNQSITESNGSSIKSTELSNHWVEVSVTFCRQCRLYYNFIWWTATMIPESWLLAWAGSRQCVTFVTLHPNALRRWRTLWPIHSVKLMPCSTT